MYYIASKVVNKLPLVHMVTFEFIEESDVKDVF